MTPFENCQRGRREIMPVGLDLEAGLSKAALPYVWGIAVHVPRNPVEEITIAVSEPPQTHPIKKSGHGKLAGEVLVRDTKNEHRSWFEYPAGFIQDRLNMRNVLKHRVAKSTSEVRAGERRAGCVRFHHAPIRVTPPRFTKRSSPRIQANIDGP